MHWLGPTETNDEGQHRCTCMCGFKTPWFDNEVDAQEACTFHIVVNAFGGR